MCSENLRIKCWFGSRQNFCEISVKGHVFTTFVGFLESFPNNLTHPS